jgi:hypothetical protein
MFLAYRNIGTMRDREWNIHRSWIMKALSPSATQRQSVFHDARFKALGRFYSREKAHHRHLELRRRR